MLVQWSYREKRARRILTKFLKLVKAVLFFLPYQYQGQKGDLRGDQKRFVYKFFFIYEFAHQPPTQTQPTYYDFN